MNSKKVLVVGAGAREHALIAKISESRLLKAVYTTNPYFARFAKYLEVDPNNFLHLASVCKSEEIDLVVIGQEKYLASGITDSLIAEGIPVFGPTKNASKLESSKFFTKEIADMNSIPIAKYTFCSSVSNLEKSIKGIGSFPVVVKANGLADGKGVFICNTMQEAMQIGTELLEGALGEAGSSIIIEEFLEGRELSYFVLVDGQTILPIGYARDHKKIIYQGKSYNTGGMGAYSPVTISQKVEHDIIRKIIYPTISALSAVNIQYKGVLFAGLILSKGTPKLLEYNVRFGDPETQAILPRLESDLLELMLHTVNGTLDRASIAFSDQSCLSVVLATKGYPLKYDKGFPITGVESAMKEVSDIQILNAGVRYDEQGNMFSNGGRVLNIVAKGKDITECKLKAKRAIEIIQWKEGVFLEELVS